MKTISRLRIWLVFFDMDEMMNELVLWSKDGKKAIVGNKDVRTIVPVMEHLTCFVPGMLLLGAHELPKSMVNPKWTPLAFAVLDSCNDAVQMAKTGLAPERWSFDEDTGAVHASWDLNNNLRPEIAESNYYAWYYTGDDKYRKRAQSMFESFKKHSKSQYGYAATNSVSGVQLDSQESFFMAETMKYLYLTLAPKSTISLKK